MTLPSSGPITIGQILAEIGDSYPVTIPNANWRTLANKPSGSLVIPNDFWGKTWPVKLVASSVDTTDRSGSYTFAGLNFGDDFTGRTLVALVHLAAGGNVTLDQTPATIGGTTTSGGDAGDLGQGGTPVGAAGGGVWAAKPSGTSGSVVVNFSGGSASACAVYLFAVTDVASATPHAFSVGAGGSGGITSDPTYPASMNGTLNVPSGGSAVIFGSATRANNTAAITLVGMTQAYDVTLDGSHRIAGGYAFRLPQETNRSVGLSTSTGNVIFGMRAASFA